VAKRSCNKTSAGEAEAHYAVPLQADSVIHGIQLLNMHPDALSGQTENAGREEIRFSASSQLIS
jgi:hypothetical protein